MSLSGIPLFVANRKFEPGTAMQVRLVSLLHPYETLLDHSRCHNELHKLQLLSAICGIYLQVGLIRMLLLPNLISTGFPLKVTESATFYMENLTSLIEPGKTVRSRQGSEFVRQSEC